MAVKAKGVVHVLLLTLSAIAGRLTAAQGAIKFIQLQPCAPPTRDNVSLDISDTFRVLANYSLCAKQPESAVAFKIYSEISSTVEGASIVFVARVQENVLEWALPYQADSYTASSPLVQQTLVQCFTKDSYNSSGFPYIDVFTDSAIPLNYTLSVDLVNPFVLNLSVKYEVQVSSLQSQLFYFEFPDNVSIVTVDLTSQTYDCAVASLQEGSVCPPASTLYDLLARGIYQTMTNSSFFTVSREGLNEPSFYIILLKANDSFCSRSGKTNGTGLEIAKNVTIIINESRVFSGYTAAVCIAVLGIFFVMILLTIVVYFGCFFLVTKCNARQHCDQEEQDKISLVFRCLQHSSFMDSDIDKKYHCFCFPKHEDAYMNEKVEEVLQRYETRDYKCVSNATQTDFTNLLGIRVKNEDIDGEVPSGSQDASTTAFSSRMNATVLEVLSKRIRVHYPAVIEPNSSTRALRRDTDRYRIQVPRNEADLNDGNVANDGYYRVEFEEPAMYNCETQTDTMTEAEVLDSIVYSLKARTGVTHQQILDLPEDELRVSHTSTKSQDELKYASYVWNTLTVAIYYGIPAFQIVLFQQFSQQLSSNVMRDKETCYYNFRCAIPHSVFPAVNNLLSNLGYITCGLGFIVVLAIRGCACKNQVTTYGLSQHTSLYYAMGCSLTIEGIMGGLYHMCPNDANYQFDTTFMYVIVGLTIAKLIQIRRPDFHAEGFIAFFSFSVVTLITVISIYGDERNPTAIRVILLFLILVTLAIFIVSLYKFHQWKFIFQSVRNIKHELLSAPRRKCLLVRLLVALAFNTLSAGLLLFADPKSLDTPTIVLVFFLLNLVIYLFYYGALKCFHSEPGVFIPLLFAVVAIGFWFAGITIFGMKTYDTTRTPAESRQLNAECLAGDFYDNHDVWHFLAAAALFFSFMAILALDDGLAHRPRKDIHIF